MKVTTNNRVRALDCYAELPESARADFDYVDPEEHYTPRFVQYKGEWIDTGDAERCPESIGAGKWHGMRSDSFFSAVVWRFVDDFEYVVVGTAIA